MLKKIFITSGWLLFFGFFILFTIPRFISYAQTGLPDYMGATLMQNQIRFIIHALSGTIVYITAVIQLTPYFRNKHISLHRKSGKVYIISSLICIATLALILPEGSCVPCRASQYIVTGLWFIFILTGYYFIRVRNFEWHRRFMISSFICAAYFVTVRVIDLFAMRYFTALFKNEGTALLVSDVFVWAFPLSIFWVYLLLINRIKPIKIISLKTTPPYKI